MKTIPDYKNELVEVCKNINQQIIDAYTSVMDNDFHIAWIAREYDTEPRGYEDKYHFKEFIMKDRILNFKLRNVKYSNTRDESIYYVNYEGISADYNKISTAINDIFGLKIYTEKESRFNKNRQDFLEEICLGNQKFNGTEKFFKYCSDSFFNESKNIKSKIEILSNLPSEIIEAPKKYDEFLEQTGKSQASFLDKINKNIGKYKNSIDYIDMYVKNPPMFLEKFRQLQETEQDSVIELLVKEGKLQGDLETDGILSKEFGERIGRVIRMKIPEKAKKNG